MPIRIRISSDTFRELRENNSYYIDKTDVIQAYLEDHFEKAILFTRPRRFGKTVTMTMFRDFLDIRQDSRKIFEGLSIMHHPETVHAYMNQYPVIFLTLKEIFGRDYGMIFRSFQNLISTLCKSWDILLSSESVNKFDKLLLEKLMAGESGEVDTVEALDLLTRMLHTHYKKPVFVIIDEYDVPMAKTYGTPAYEQVRDMIERMLSYVCKTNEHVKAVILSGCLYTVKSSTYTGVNNITPYTVLSPVFATSIGFTDTEVKKLLDDAGLPDLYDDTVEEWYDGYLFGRDRMYCPWDVLSFVKSKLENSYSEARGPKSYWLNTSETSQNLIHGFFGKTDGANERFEQLLAENSIEVLVNEFVPYHLIHENGENLWSALLETGYLTKAVTEEMSMMPLKIPNRSIQAVFRQEVWAYFGDKVDNAFVHTLVNALWAREIQNALNALNQILEATLSFYHEYREYSYHLILDGFFTGMGYRVLSELETGYGRSDLIILDAGRKRSMVLELKHVTSQDEMAKALLEAESQIVRKKYESSLIYDGYTTRIQYAMSFYDKQSLIASVH
ncbi:MAG: AAA family ATPase [Clostridia bacterium]|nr:AAA family ATPase [Clostridia bacterium]